MPSSPAAGVLNHSMLRVRDPEVSLAFYARVFDFVLLHRLDFSAGKFSLYFLTDASQAGQAPTEEGEKLAWLFAQRGVLELTHNWGTESQPEFHYHDGNAEPQGFGHICVSVPDLEAAVAHCDACEVTFVKRPEQGAMRDIAFVRDPDGYWIELLQADRMTALRAS